MPLPLLSRKKPFTDVAGCIIFPLLLPTPATLPLVTAYVALPLNTLSKKGGATLEQRQYTMGHKRPETTQRYDRDKDNLDDSAVDYIKV